MPLFKAREISPDDALKQDLCPECAHSLVDESALSHLNRHWEREPNAGSDGDEARRRRNLLREYVKSHNVRPSHEVEAEAKAAATQKTIEPAS
jgi:hypothetical protein